MQTQRPTHLCAPRHGTPDMGDVRRMCGVHARFDRIRHSPSDPQRRLRPPRRQPLRRTHRPGQRLCVQTGPHRRGRRSRAHAGSQPARMCREAEGASQTVVGCGRVLCLLAATTPVLCIRALTMSPMRQDVSVRLRIGREKRNTDPTRARRSASTPTQTDKIRPQFGQARL